MYCRLPEGSAFCRIAKRLDDFRPRFFGVRFDFFRAMHETTHTNITLRSDQCEIWNLGIPLDQNLLQVSQ